MATAATIDIDALLRPISESAPAGADLRADVSPTSIYYRLKDARSAARAAERRADAPAQDGDQASEAAGRTLAMSADWQTIFTLAPKALQESSKDLEVVAWFTESLLRAHGFAGLRDGIHLARGLIEQYWESFFSLVDEDGMATRLAPLAGLNGQGNEGTLIQPLRKVPLTHGANENLLAAYHFDQARALMNLADAEQRARREAAGATSMERFMAAVNASGSAEFSAGEFYASLLEDMDGTLAELALLDTALSERAGRDAPSMRDIAQVLTAIRDSVQVFSKELVDRWRAASNGAAAGASQANGAGGESSGAAAAGGPVRGREEALRVLQQVAEYFRTNEPHSPIATSLDEIVRRAKMPFAELLAELLPDPSAWRSALTSAGIKPPPQ
jgi:type VI secretion system protein ImpA